MVKRILIAVATIAVVFIVDQYIKGVFVDGYNLKGSCIDLTLHYNRGVAFSMFESLGDYLKWIQLIIISGIIIFVYYEGYLYRYPFAIGAVIGGAIGNLYDRFIREGVVDYVAWHCGFNFAIFNFADVMIDIGVALIILLSILNDNSTRV